MFSQIQLQVSVGRERDDSSERSAASDLLEGPTSIHCHICGRVFNRAAIDKHERQCLKRYTVLKCVIVGVIELYLDVTQILFNFIPTN